MHNVEPICRLCAIEGRLTESTLPLNTLARHARQQPRGHGASDTFKWLLQRERELPLLVCGGGVSGPADIAAVSR